MHSFPAVGVYSPIAFLFEWTPKGRTGRCRTDLYREMEDTGIFYQIRSAEVGSICLFEILTHSSSL